VSRPAHSPTARLVTIVLRDDLLDASSGGPKKAEFGEIRTEHR
jgi:hypothetical protein